MKRKRLLRLTHEERMVLARPANIAIAVFAVTTLLILTGLINPFDTALVLDLRHSHPWTDDLFKITESPGQRRFVYPIAIIISVVFTVRRRDLLPTITTVSALLFTNAVTGVFKLLTLRGFPRYGGPEAWNVGDRSIQDVASNLGAYPSGHGANIAAASTLMVLAAYSARPKYRPYATHITVFTVFLSLVTFVSSWLRDTHWVTDLLGGVSLGVATTIYAALWALHLPDHWRHPELAGRPRLVIGSVGVIALAAIFMFAANTFLSHSATSIVLILATFGIIAHESRKGIKRAAARKAERG